MCDAALGHRSGLSWVASLQMDAILSVELEICCLCFGVARVLAIFGPRHGIPACAVQVHAEYMQALRRCRTCRVHIPGRHAADAESQPWHLQAHFLHLLQPDNCPVHAPAEPAEYLTWYYMGAGVGSGIMDARKV